MSDTPARTTQPLNDRQQTPGQTYGPGLWISAIAVATIVGLLIWNSWQTRESSLQLAKVTLEYQARALGEQLTSNLLNLERQLQFVSTKPEALMALKGDAPEAFFWELKQRSFSEKGVIQYRFFDVDGVQRATTDGATSDSISVKTERFFIKHQKQFYEYVFEAPLRLTPEGPWLLSMSRSIYDSQGTFVGVAQTLMKMNDLRIILAGEEFGGFESSAFFDAERTILSFWPPARNETESLIGRKLNKDLRFSGVFIAEDGASNWMARTGDNRIVASYKISNFPLYVGLTRPYENILAPWSQQLSHTLWAIAIIIVGFLVLIFFVIRRTHIEQELNLAVHRLHSAVEQSPINIIITDTAGNIEYVNPAFCQVTQYSKEEVLGKNPRLLKTGHTPKAVYKELWDTIIRGNEWHGEFLNKKKSGEVFWESANISPIRDQDGKITDRQRHEEELRKAKNDAEAAALAKSEFLASMSHEIRTPMTGVMGFADLLLEDDLKRESRNKVLKIKDATRSLLAIINDILDMSKMEAKKMEIDTIDFHLPSEIDKVVALFKEKDGGRNKKNLTLTTILSDDFPIGVNSDPTRLRQILINLIGNAVKFTEHGSVTIEGSLALSDTGKPVIKLVVTDTGIGMTPETLEKLFTDFTQADTSITRRFEGTGLGLAICKRLLDLMGGEIGVESTYGKGSRFWFTLPYVRAKTVVAVQAPETTGSQRFETLKPLNVLIAEDNRINQQILKAMIVRLGHLVTLVNNGIEAVDAHRRNRFDLILSDVRMPVMSGPDAARAIRRLEGPKGKIPIIALTADAMEEHKQGYLDAGMNTVVTKPVDLNELTRAINAVMGEQIHKPVEMANPFIEPLLPELSEAVDEADDDAMDAVDDFLSQIGASSDEDKTG